MTHHCIICHHVPTTIHPCFIQRCMYQEVLQIWQRIHVVVHLLLPRETIAGLATAVAKDIKPELADQVDLADEESAFSNVSSQCLGILVLGLNTRLDGCLQVGRPAVTSSRNKQHPCNRRRCWTFGSMQPIVIEVHHQYLVHALVIAHQKLECMAPCSGRQTELSMERQQTRQPIMCQLETHKDSCVHAYQLVLCSCCTMLLVEPAICDAWYAGHAADALGYL